MQASNTGFADRIFSSSDKTNIIDAQIYENYQYFYYSTGASPANKFDCDRSDGITGNDYRAHIKHEIGHAIGLNHYPKDVANSHCLMFPNSSYKPYRDFCNGEVYSASAA